MHLLTQHHCVFSQAGLSAILCVTMGPSILFMLVMDFIDQLTAEARHGGDGELHS